MIHKSLPKTYFGLAMKYLGISGIIGLGVAGLSLGIFLAAFLAGDIASASIASMIGCVGSIMVLIKMPFWD